MIIGKVFWFIWVIGKSREGRRNTSFFNGQIIVCTDSKSVTLKTLKGFCLYDDHLEAHRRCTHY